MKCRYTLGLILGAIYLVSSTVIFIVQSIYFNIYKDIEDPKEQKVSRNSAIKTLIICAITAIIAALFIYAIVKRKYKLAYPWLIFCAGIIFGTLKVIIYAIIDCAKDRITGEETTFRIVICFLIMAVEIPIYWFSLTVYRKLRKEEKSANESIAYQSDYISVPNKV